MLFNGPISQLLQQMLEFHVRPSCSGYDFDSSGMFSISVDAPGGESFQDSEVIRGHLRRGLGSSLQCSRKVHRCLHPDAAPTSTGGSLYCS
uniref:Uncharacterized protein n=1 Tax=Rhizophora mucronata TaxID=61149 RepID=A0A2P2NJ24_RHIMU